MPVAVLKDDTELFKQFTDDESFRRWMMDAVSGGAIVDRIQDARILLVTTYWPESEPPWVGYRHTTTLALNCLSRLQNRR